jgi:hypothetical protein
MLVEKHFIDAKQKEAAEKRHQEEVKEYLNEWGMAKSFYREEVEKKQEMKSLINYLETHKPKDKRRLYQEQNEELNNEETGGVNTVGNVLTAGNVNTVTVASIQSDSRKPDQPIPSEYNEADEFLNKLVVDSNIIHHKNEKIREEIKKKEKVPADLVQAMKTDSVYETRKVYGTVCDFKELDNQKKANEDYFPLSAYDTMYSQVFPKQAPKEAPRPSSHQYVRKHINSASYLDLRKTVTTFKSNELARIHETLSKSGNKMDMDSVRKAFLPPVETVGYNKYFLPLPGYGLIAKPEEPVKKKKKVKKK